MPNSIHDIKRCLAEKLTQLFVKCTVLDYFWGAGNQLFITFCCQLVGSSEGIIQGFAKPMIMLQTLKMLMFQWDTLVVKYLAKRAKSSSDRQVKLLVLIAIYAGSDRET